MAKVAFPSYDVQTSNGWAGGIGSFIVHFARQLRARGDEVTIIALERPVDPEWRERYKSWGIGLIEIHNEVAPERWPKIWPVTISEYLTPLLRDFDVVYFCDAGNVAFNLVRMKRLGASRMPVCVTVLHGSLNWVLDGRMPELPDHLYNVFAEQYSARHSDYVISPSRYMVDWVDRQGWQLPQEPEIVGLPFIPLAQPPAARRAGQFKRLVYFARLQRLKGYELFVDGLLQLRRETPEVLAQLTEVVLLGHEDVAGAADWVRQQLLPTGLSVRHIGNFNSQQAQAFLAAHVADALVVIPSAFENFPYAVIETSLITGLNIICTRGGGTPEIFAGRGDAQLFDPRSSALAAKLRERLRRPLRPSELARYDFAGHNDRWLYFHDRICGRAGAETASVARPDPISVDVCINYSNQARHFPQLLQSLDLQTSRDFRVIAIDNDSTAPNAAALFDYMADKYRDRGWIFVRQNHDAVDARNRAAEQGTAAYLLFVDPDNVLTTNAIERLLHAAQNSGDEYLTAGSLHFSGDRFPYDKNTGQRTTPILQINMPLGPALAAAVIDPFILGNGVALIRRDVFDAVGGYQKLCSGRHGDWALQIKLAARGYRTDVVPEYLYYSRQPVEDRSREAGLVRARGLLGLCDEQLAIVGLQGAASAVHHNFAMLRERKDYADALGRQLRLSHERFNVFGFEPLPADSAPAAPPTVPAILESIPPVRRTTVLVIIPTLRVGGAEMDLLRNLPRLDPLKFRIVVFTFLARGTLAPALANTGIEIVGPFAPFRFHWFRDLKGVVLAWSRKLALSASRSVSLLRNVLASIAPEPIGRAWRRLKLWLRLRHLLPRKRRLREMLRSIRNAARLLWLKSRIEFARLSSRLIGLCKNLVRLLPRPVLRFAREALALQSYFLIGVGLLPFIRMRGIDLIHTVLPNSYLVGSIANLWVNNRPLIMSRVGLNSYQQTLRIVGFIERRLCHHKISAAVGNCAAILGELREEGIPDSGLRLIRNGIDVADFSWQMVERSGARETLGLPKAAIVISVVANLHGYKGHVDLLRALYSVHHNMPEWIVLVVGRDMDGNRARLGGLSEELGIRSRVRFLGERADIPAILSAADIHVSCSHTEGLPNNVLEAMCARLPVVATAVGGVGELVVDKKTGLLVPPHDPIKLGQAILSLARAEGLRRRMGEIGRAHVVTHFAIDQSARALAQLYAEIAEGSQPNSTSGKSSAGGMSDAA
ncbi:MAG TPA: glycosyltransferase [Steroidobacteraceae bacterium]